MMDALDTMAHAAIMPARTDTANRLPSEALRLFEIGQDLVNERRHAEAAHCFRGATGAAPAYALAHNGLGVALHGMRRYEGAVEAFRRAVELQPDLRIARRNLAMLLVELRRLDESLSLWRAELLSGREGLQWLNQLVTASMRSRDLTRAGDYATVLAAVRRASPWYPRRTDDSTPMIPVQTRKEFLTVPKLRHDADQLRYLQRRSVLGAEFSPVIDEYERLAERMARVDPNARIPLERDVQRSIGHVYNRIIHVRPTPRLRRALSDRWDPAAVERAYIGMAPGVVVIDDFLTPEALDGVRQFCLESTVWFANRYAHGRLGAFLHDGFNCPLLLQVAEELRTAFPQVIGNRYTLRQLWGFKNADNLPGDATVHADFAAVNVNFWITPEEANLDPASGGLVVYGVDAPAHWDFYTYNGRADIIKPFLVQQGARSITIPYRQNRAIIFNSDLFHATAAVRFRPGYEDRRINVTMLYGDRSEDVHHRTASPEQAEVTRNAWRSAAFARARGS